MGNLLTAKEIREMDERERERELLNKREELMILYSNQTGGGLSDNPGKPKILRKEIARILTVMNEEKR
jgi:large subunit ribosomal protein L29